jgi:Bacteriophage tail sheath protein
MPEYLTPGVYIEEIEIGAKPIEGVSTSTVGFVGMTMEDEDTDLDKPVLITSWGQFTKKFGRYDATKAPYLPPAVYGFFANGGGRCFVVKVKDAAADGDYVGTDGGPGARTGLNAFNEIDEVNIVCIPGVTSTTVQKAMITHCETMKDRFCILDAVESSDMTEIQAQKDNVVSTDGYAALYYPWIKVPVESLDANSKVQLDVKFMPPSGYVAGIYARSDTNRGVHKAPANELVRDVQELEVSITKGEQGILNPKGINCIRSFPGRGILVWGARTTASNTLWKYINVRRLFLFLEESIEEGTQWVVFEPNDEKLWARVIQTIRQFLTKVWKDGALMGSTPEEAFFVKCDRTTMTQDDIDNGRLICMIGVAPVKPAEFVVFRIAQWQGGSAVSE